MTSKPLGSLLANLDVTRSHNRPRTSNDNPYSEAQFKTMKYTPDYPNRFDSLGHARAWMEECMAWYNHEHRHSRIGLHTPASVHYGTAHDIRAARQTILDAAWLAHPERFNRRPAAPRLPERVTINRPGETNPEPPTSEGLRRLT
jgi:putative transposase